MKDLTGKPSVSQPGQRPIDRVLSMLEGVRESGGQHTAKCPAHNDQNPSLSVKEGDDGRVLLHCHGGCSVPDICAAIGIKERDLFVPSPTRSRQGNPQNIVAVYPYFDEKGQLLFETIRLKPKGFRQRRPDGNGGWIRNIKDVRRILYRLPQLIVADPTGWVFVAEGEKDVDRLIALGLAATTNPMGAGKWGKVDDSALQGRKVVILPDNDTAGLQHGHQVASALRGKATHLRIVNLPNLPHKGDVSDWLDAGGTAEKLLQLVEETPDWISAPAVSGQKSGHDDEAHGHGQRLQYEMTPEGIVWLKPSKEGIVPVRLTNFPARIVADISYDDGVERRNFFDVEVTLHGVTRVVTVPASAFSGLGWVSELLGASAWIYAGFAVKDHARLAIQILSKWPVPTRVVYRHTGWVDLNRSWTYLHAAGAIGPNGTVPDVEVQLEGGAEKFELPPPPEGGELVAAVRASLRVLGLAKGTIVVPAFCAIWRVVLGPCDFTLHLAGLTGTFKTELASLVQQHFGAELDSRHLPGSWSSTDNALENMAFTLKDVVFVVDDFAPTGSAADVLRLQRKADRVIRAQGNRSARGRMRSDCTTRASKPPRGLMFSTGEDIPGEQSCRARQVVIEIEEGDIAPDALTACQQDASTGRYAAAMAAFLRWLAPRYGEVKRTLREQVISVRQRLTRPFEHRRTTDQLAELAVGLDYFLRFAQEVGALDDQETKRIQAQAQAALEEVGRAQRVHQVSSDPVTRFVELLQAAIGSGRAHLTGLDGGCPDSAQAWGWKCQEVSSEGYPQGSREPRGDRIGWVRGNDVYLIPDAAYKAAQGMVAGAGGGLVIAPSTLFKRLKERGLLITTDEQRHRNTIRVVLEGKRQEVLHLLAETIMAEEEAQVSQQPLQFGMAGSDGPQNHGLRLGQ